MRYIKLLSILIIVLLVGCYTGSQEDKDRNVVDNQQEHYGKVHPIPFFEYSIPRDTLIQIYSVITQHARSTYTIIESVTGETKFHGPSVGYGIPADTSLTNPLKPSYSRMNSSGEVIEQAEPNGLFSSKNTDGTWVLFVERNGDVTPVYTEHKVTTFPFAVKRNDNGEWIRADDKKASTTIKLITSKQ